WRIGRLRQFLSPFSRPLLMDPASLAKKQHTLTRRFCAASIEGLFVSWTLWTAPEILCPGGGPFAVMVALLAEGETVASWIFDPVGGSVFSAVKGYGAIADGKAIAGPFGTARRTNKRSERRYSNSLPTN